MNSELVLGSNDKNLPYIIMARANDIMWNIFMPSILKNYKWVKLMTPQDWVDNGGRVSEGNLITMTTGNFTLTHSSGSISTVTLTTTPILVSTLNLEDIVEMDYYHDGAGGGSYYAIAVMFYD